MLMGCGKKGKLILPKEKKAFYPHFYPSGPQEKIDFLHNNDQFLSYNHDKSEEEIIQEE